MRLERGRDLLRFLDTRWSLLAVVALALALRLINLAGRPIWYDEAIAVLRAELPFETMIYGTVSQVEGAAADVHPLLYFALLHLWMDLVGQSPAAVRALSVLMGTATVGVVYLLAARLYNRRIGLAAAAITAVAPFAVYYSQEARMYALLGLAAAAAAYFLVQAWQGGRWYHWAAFGLCGALTLHTHNLGFAFLGALDLWLLWSWLRRGRDRLRLLASIFWSHLLMLALFAPWLAIVPSQLGKIQQAYWVQRPGLVEAIQTAIIFHFGYDNQALPDWLLPAALAFSLLTIAAVTLELGRAHRNRRDLAPHLLPILLALVPPLLLASLSLFRPVYIVRALLPSALTYYILVAGTLSARTVPRAVRWGLLLPAALLVVLSLANHYTYDCFPRPPFDQLAAYLREHQEPGDAIVHSNKLTFLPTHYYDRDLSQAFIGDQPGSPSDTLAYPTQQALGLFAAPSIEAAAAGHEGVLFVVFRREIDEYLQAGYAEHPHLTWLREHYSLASVTSFSDLELYEFRAAVSPPATGEHP
jgi:mannosyltransferase